MHETFALHLRYDPSCWLNDSLMIYVGVIKIDDELFISVKAIAIDRLIIIMKRVLKILLQIFFLKNCSEFLCTFLTGIITWL
jgi:hypothetical protein